MRLTETTPAFDCSALCYNLLAKREESCRDYWYCRTIEVSSVPCRRPQPNHRIGQGSFWSHSYSEYYSPILKRTHNAWYCRTSREVVRFPLCRSTCIACEWPGVSAQVFWRRGFANKPDW